MGDYERWEVQQLVRSGVLMSRITRLDEEQVLGFEETEAELDVELNDVQPTFIEHDGKESCFASRRWQSKPTNTNCKGSRR